MKYKRISAFIICFAMLTSTGCSLGKKNSSSSEVSGISYTSDSYEKYDLDDFSFELNKDFTVEEKYENDDGTGASYYDFTSKDLQKLSIGTQRFEHCTADVYVQVFFEDINSRKNNPATDVETEKLDVPGINAAAIHMTNIDDNGESGESYLYLTVEGSEMRADINGYKPEDRGKVKALFRDIASSVKYTGTPHLPVEQQSYECDLFSLNCGSEWYIDDYKDDDSGQVSVQLKYNYAQDIEHYSSPSLLINVRHQDEWDNASKAADEEYESEKKYSFVSECERSNEEIFGYNAETVSYVLKTGHINNRIKTYYYNENGYLYTISEALNMRDEEGSKSELKDILDTVVIKKISDEEIEKRKQAYEKWRYPSYTFHGASFNLISKLELERELDDSSDAVSFYGGSPDLKISLEDYEGDLENAAQRDYNELSGYDYKDLNIKEVSVGSNKYMCVSGINNREDGMAEDYLIIVNGKLWKFYFGIDRDTYADDKFVIDRFLESLDFSNAE